MGTDPTIVVLIYLVGAALLLCELVMPSAILGLAGMGAMIVGIVQAFKVSLAFGAVLALLTIVGAPMAIYHGLKRLALKRSLGDKEGCTSAAEDLSSLVNEEGTALTPLHPAGTARVSGRRLDVITEGDMIDAGARVRVIRVEGAKVVVKRA